MSIQDGGPAFPRSPHSGEQSDDGMTLRDYFAAKAITGCLPGSMLSEETVQEYARLAYRMAGAMLKAREQKP